MEEKTPFMCFPSFWFFVIKCMIRSGLTVTINAVFVLSDAFHPLKAAAFVLSNGGFWFQRPWTPGYYERSLTCQREASLSWNKAIQSLYSPWYAALKMQTKARQGQGQCPGITSPRQSPAAETFPAALALTSLWYSLQSGGSEHDHSPWVSALPGRWGMLSAQCTVCSLQSAEPVCEASSP